MSLGISSWCNSSLGGIGEPFAWVAGATTFSGALAIFFGAGLMTTDGGGGVTGGAATAAGGG